MATLSELRAVRLEKLKKLEDFGMNPYPSNVPKDTSLAELRAQFDNLVASGTTVSVVGRIMSLRGQGAILFVTLFDGTDKFQVVFKKDEIEESLFKLFGEAADLGDFISVTGILFTTQKGEPSVQVSVWQMATKALLPIPSEHYGLEDDDERLRKRYLEAVLNPIVFKRFEIRSKVVSAIRRFLIAKTLWK